MTKKTTSLAHTTRKAPGMLSSGRILLRVIFFIMAAFLFSPGILPAEDRGKVLIINSNASVKKYSQMQSAFKAQYPEQATEIDIGSKWLDEKVTEKTIRNANPDLIVCIGSKAYLLAGMASKNTPTIFSLGINWQRFQLTDNTYVVASEPRPMMELTTYRYFFPEMKKVGVIYSKDHNKEWYQTAVDDGKEVGIEVIGVSVKKEKEVETALKGLLPKVDALWLISDPIVLSDMAMVQNAFKLSDEMKKPVFSYDALFASFGASFITSADVATMGGQVARLARAILQNEDLPEKIQYPAGSHIAINVKKIERYGIKLNPKALSSVNDFIE